MDAKGRHDWKRFDTQAAPVILDDLSDLKLWLTVERDRDAMLERLKRDWILFDLVETAFDPAPEPAMLELRPKVLALLEKYANERIPLLFGTCDRLLHDLEDVEADDAKTALRRRREEIFAERKQITAAAKSPEWPLAGWIKP